MLRKKQLQDHFDMIDNLLKDAPFSTVEEQQILARLIGDPSIHLSPTDEQRYATFKKFLNDPDDGLKRMAKAAICLAMMSSSKLGREFAVKLKPLTREFHPALPNLGDNQSNQLDHARFKNLCILINNLTESVIPYNTSPEEFVLQKARQVAKLARAEKGENMVAKVLEARQKLSQALSSLNNSDIPNADAYRQELQDLQDKLMLDSADSLLQQRRVQDAVHVWLEILPQSKHYSAAHFAAFRHAYLSYRDSLDAGTAFVKALPICLDDQRRLLVFKDDNLKDFDGFLLEAAGIKQQEADKIMTITDELRMTLMHYVLLRTLKVPGPTSVTNPTLFSADQLAANQQLATEIMNLPPITKVEDCVRVKQAIEDCWERASTWMKKNPAKNSDMPLLFTAVAQLADAKVTQAAGSKA